MKGKKEQEYRSLRERFVRHFAKFGAENITYAFYNSCAWTNGVDYMMPLYNRDWNVIGMTAYMLNLETGEYVGMGFSEKQDFFDFIAEIIAADTNKHPDTPKYHKLMLERFAKFEKFK